MDYYKIMDIDKNRLKILFHGINGSRTVNQYEFIRSVQKRVRDSANGPVYTSGWHVLSSLQGTLDYLGKFQNIKSKVIVRCHVAGNIWPKQHSPTKGLVLAEYIYICEIVMGVREIQWYFMKHKPVQEN